MPRVSSDDRPLSKIHAELRRSGESSKKWQRMFEDSYLIKRGVMGVTKYFLDYKIFDEDVVNEGERRYYITNKRGGSSKRVTKTPSVSNCRDEGAIIILMMDTIGHHDGLEGRRSQFYGLHRN